MLEITGGPVGPTTDPTIHVIDALIRQMDADIRDEESHTQRCIDASLAGLPMPDNPITSVKDTRAGRLIRRLASYVSRGDTVTLDRGTLGSGGDVYFPVSFRRDAHPVPAPYMRGMLTVYADGETRSNT